MTSRLSIALLLTSLLTLPFAASAQVNAAAGTDAMCVAKCKIIQEQGLPPCPATKISCGALTTKGTCMPDGCKGESAAGVDGGMKSIGELMGLAQKFMEMFKKSPAGGGDKGQPPPPTTGQQAGAQGCTAYYQVTVPSSDPCAYFVPPTSSSLLNNMGSSTADALLGALSGTGQSAIGDALGEGDSGSASVSEKLLNDAINLNGDVHINIPTTPTTTLNGNLGGSAVNLQPGTQGDIQLHGTGATVFATSRDPGSNTEVAGFYGGDTFGANQPQGIVASMCQSRPWSNSVVAFVIPPSFFDSLCAWRGYQVGAPQVTVSTGSQTQTTTKQTTTSTNTNTNTETNTQTQQPVSSLPPEVDIWAVPTSVPLGSRTSIFWSTTNTASCQVTSSDGSFSESTLSGGASTVPLSGATKFTISCVGGNGATVTDDVTVNLSI